MIDLDTPIIRARHAALAAISKVVDSYVEDYEYYGPSGEGISVPISKRSRELIADCIAGLHADDEFVKMWDAWRALCVPERPAVREESK